jgi:hypothetical protein
MAQHDYIISNATFPAVRTDINNALSAIQTTNSGTSRPTGAVAGQLWLDTTSATTPTLKYYDGADDISLATIDHTANTVNWLDSTVSITGLSTTATGTVLTLSDSVNTTTVNLIIDNQKEIRFRETTANGTNYVALKAPASLSADLTFTLPSTDGTNGQVLQTNGSGVLSFTTVSADGTADWDTTVKTTGFTATANKGYFCNTTSSAFTVTLPSSPSAGDEVIIVDYAGTFATNNLNITSTPKINGSDNDVKLTTNREATRLVYINSTQGWLAYSGVNEGTAPSLTDNPPTYSVDFLVIAGGGGGGSRHHSAGGGAGGYRNSYLTETSGGGGSSEASLTFNIGTVYTVTVGAGGSGGSGSGGNNNGVAGSNSSISGTGITTITSSGGGYGATYDLNGGAGGSGGGGGEAGGSSRTGGSGTANQGYAGGNNSSGTGGGGGGAGEAGNTDGQKQGGDGLASSITGSSVTRGGGGGGGESDDGRDNLNNGGTGGGGHAALGGSNNGTANTGGGGGGNTTSASDSTGSGGTGGSGVVILRMPTASYSGTTTGSPTVSTDGSDTVVIFNSSGSITG